ncbi:MAG: hypothetical protein F6K48_28900 [Okeania sp. SIO3H1]|nr:hypothetical protein [Okeania sp. SIO1I7]NEN92701.1 hypothetical protein [Okeania sp. SIO3H1]NET27345.1 hypothetical protein [Okeania sp. SIO1I7]
MILLYSWEISGGGEVVRFKIEVWRQLEKYTVQSGSIITTNIKVCIE